MLCEHDFNQADKNCPICFPSERYQIFPDNSTGKPLVQIFRNGNLWLAPGDRNFRFGTRKAAIILYCIKEIEQFAISNYPAEIYETCIRKVSSADPTDEVYLQSFSEFERTDGEVIRMPFLRLDRVINSIPSTHYSFGQTKAIALVVLKDELMDWFQSMDHMYSY